MMNMREHSAAVPHLGLVDRVGKRSATSLLQRRLDLPGNAFEFGIWHGKPHAGLAEISEAGDMRGIILRYHDRQRVADVGYRGPNQQTARDGLVDFLQPSEIGI